MGWSSVADHPGEVRAISSTCTAQQLCVDRVVKTQPSSCSSEEPFRRENAPLPVQHEVCRNRGAEGEAEPHKGESSRDRTMKRL